MQAYLSRLNRQRLFRRNEKRSNKKAQQYEQQLSAEECADIKAILRQFEPQATGHDLIRIGPDFDGGYILPDDLDGIEALYSPGVSDTSGFDVEIAERGVPCFLADGTVEEPSYMHPLMSFDKMMIGDGPKDTYITLEDWVAQTAPKQGDLMLQMDIEGAEYDVLLATPHSLLSRFRVIVLELHWLDRYLLGHERQKLKELIEHLQENHSICHVHANTVCPPVNLLGAKVPPILELTLLHKDRMQPSTETEVVYPHPLDAVNDEYLPHRDFPAFWNAS